MEKMEKFTSHRLESKFNSEIDGYFARAGSFGHIALMVLFYTALFIVLGVGYLIK